MARLSRQWIFEPVFDFEYKTYQLRAYLRDLELNFSRAKFYPYLSDLHLHIEDIRKYKVGILKMEESLHRDLTEVDIKNQRLLREALPDEGGVIHELGQIADYAGEHLADTLRDGTNELSKTSEEICISPLGIVAGSSESGFLLFRKPSITRIYTYKLRMVRRATPEQAYMDVQTSYVDEIRTGLLTNFQELKWQLIKSSKSENALNAYLIETNTEIPVYETLLPLAKKYVIKAAGESPLAR